MPVRQAGGRCSKSSELVSRRRAIRPPRPRAAFTDSEVHHESPARGRPTETEDGVGAASWRWCRRRKVWATMRDEDRSERRRPGAMWPSESSQAERSAVHRAAAHCRVDRPVARSAYGHRAWLRCVRSSFLRATSARHSELNGLSRGVRSDVHYLTRVVHLRLHHCHPSRATERLGSLTSQQPPPVGRC